jgi:hypothetical protein
MSEVDETRTKVDAPPTSTEGGGRRSIKIDLLQSGPALCRCDHAPIRGRDRQHKRSHR